MTNDTTQGLFIVLAIVIFGIFVLISYMLYQDKMKTGLTAIMCDAMTITSKNTGFELPDKDCTYTFPSDENEDSDNSEIPTGLQYYKIRDSNEQRSESEVWVLIEHEQDNPNNVRIIDSGDRDGFTPETFGQDLDGTISFPNKIENWNITHINKHSFEQAKFSEIMKLPDELLVLDDYSLKQSVFSGQATFPENLEIIGIEALRDSRFTGGLDTLENVREIREDALKESEFEDSDLSELGKNADELVLADGSLGKYAPSGEFKLPENITELGNISDNNDGTFVFDSSNITSIDFSNVKDLRVIGDNTFKDAKIRGSLKIPSTVQAVGNNAFENSQITELNLTDNNELTIIGDNAFKNSNISRLEIPKDSKLNKIGKDSFKYSKLTTLDLSNAMELETIDDGSFENSELTGTIFLPDSVRRVGDRAFRKSVFNNRNWKTPSKLEYIGDFAFQNSLFRDNLYLDNSPSLKYIGDGSFVHSYNPIQPLFGLATKSYSYRYKQYLYLYLPDSLEYIGHSAFRDASFTGNFTIPRETKYIGNFNFTNSFQEYELDAIEKESMNPYQAKFEMYYSKQPEFRFNENIEYIGSGSFINSQFKDVSTIIPRKLHTLGGFDLSFATNNTQYLVTGSKSKLLGVSASNYRPMTYCEKERRYNYNRQTLKVGSNLERHPSYLNVKIVE